MTHSGDDLGFEETWRILSLDRQPAAPLDATIFACRDDAPARALPRISLDERGGGDPEAVDGTGPDLTVPRALGAGGMGKVQLAHQRSLDREVALKRPRAGAGEADGRALRDEALITGHLRDHPRRCGAGARLPPS